MAEKPFPFNVCKECCEGGSGGGEYVLTEEDKQEIVNEVLASLPNGDEVEY